MPLFSELKYNNYVPQYVGMPLDEYFTSASSIQNRYNQVAEGYSLVGELADTLQTSPLKGDKDSKMQLLGMVNRQIEDAASKGNFDEMQNEMRKLAKDYSKMASPIKENLSRFSAAEKAIMGSNLPQTHVNFLRQNLHNKPGLSYDENGLPNYLEPDSFAENVDLREVYEKYINDYKSDKYPGGIRAVQDPVTGLTEYYSNTTHEKVDAREVEQGLQQIALNDPKVQAFILQDAASTGNSIKTADDFLKYADPLMNAYTNKAAFDKIDLEFKLGEAGGYRAKKKEDEIEGLTFELNWGVPAKEGVATPGDLRKTRQSLDQSKESITEEYSRFLKNNNDPIDPLTGKSKSGIDYSEEVDLYNQQIDGIEAQKWELQEVEANAKVDAGLPLDYKPNQKVLDQAQAAYDKYMFETSEGWNRQGQVGTDEERKRRALDAYNNTIDNSNDPNLKAYRKALSKNAKDRTDVRGVTMFSKNARQEMDIIGNRILAGDWGFLKGKDVSTGRELENLDDYGNATESLGYAINNGQVELVYKAGEIDGNKFVPSDKKISVTAPPELVNQLIAKKIIDPIDLEIDRQIGPDGGTVVIGKTKADVEIKRNAQTTSAPVVVILDNRRIAFPSKGAAVKFINNYSKLNE